MPTLNERFEKHYAETYGNRTHRLNGEEREDVARASFLAGAKAEREEILGIVETIRQHNIDLHDFAAARAAQAIKERIKERDNA